MTATHRERLFYICSLSAAAFSLPLSVWLLSFFTIMVALSWFLCRGWEKLRQPGREKSHILIFLLVYAVYLAWMINTSDTASGLTELRLKLPLLIFPVVTGLLPAPDKNELRIILAAFIAGVLISSVYGIFAGVQSVFLNHADPRTLSPLISHIRLSIMAVFSIFICLWYAVYLKERSVWRIFFICSSVLLTVYLFLLLSFTGLVLFAAAFIFSGFALTYKSGRKALVAGFALLLLFAMLAVSLSVNNELRRFQRPEKPGPIPTSCLTLNGNSYFSDTLRHDRENGNPVWVFICEKELRENWNRVSKMNYDSTDKAGQKIRYTIIRYMSSAGLKKDSAGIASLARTDIRNIESGMTNRNFATWGPLKRKLYETAWQIDYYRNGGNPSGHSVTQRLVFLKTGWRIFRSHPFAGVGTGDLKSAYAAQYEKDNSPLEPGYRLLCHNQFLTFLDSFGAVGFLIVCFAVFYPFVRGKAPRHFLPALFFGITVLSMLWEDTLETHTGISFFALFYSLLVLSDNHARETTDGVLIKKDRR
jgi:hypothetical protein